MKSPFLLTATLAALYLVTGCSSEKQDGTTADADVTSKVAVNESGANGVAAVEAKTDGFTSGVATIAFGPASALPKAPASAATQQECESFLRETESDAARVVSAAGWGVTGEARIGRYQAVSFAGLFEPSTSGTCAVSKGKIALFEGGKIVALASVPASKEATIGRVRPFEDSGLRIWDGGLVPSPIADIQIVEGQGLVVQPVAAQERACGGKTIIPNIYGMPISKARAKLAKQGWEPVSNGEATDRDDAREIALADKGIREVAACSGTGFAFCSYDYKRPEAALDVTTVGEDVDPSVSGYGVRCGG